MWLLEDTFCQYFRKMSKIPWSKLDLDLAQDLSGWVVSVLFLVLFIYDPLVISEEYLI